MKDLYKILDVSPDASMQEIRERYHYLAFAYHPDRFGNSEHKKKAEADLQRVNEAYKILSDPIRRCEYDRRWGNAEHDPDHYNRKGSGSHDAKQYAAQQNMHQQYKAAYTYQTRRPHQDQKRKNKKSDSKKQETSKTAEANKKQRETTQFIIKFSSSMLVLFLIVVYTVNHISSFSKYGVFNTVSASIKHSWVWIGNNINDLVTQKEVEEIDPKVLLTDIVESEESDFAGQLNNADLQRYDLPSFDQSLALLGEFRSWTTGYSADDFIIESDLNWESASRAANWDQSGCGFVFSMQDENNLHAAYLALDGYVRLFRLVDGDYYGLKGGFYQRLDTPQGNAQLTLQKDGQEITVYINQQEVVRLEDPVLTSGEIAFAVFSGTNKPDGIHCQMDNSKLWLVY